MKNEYILNNLKQWVSLPAVSGNESVLHGFLKKEISELADEIWIDSYQNFYAIKGKPKIALFAHADSIGFIVSNVEDSKISVVPIKPKSSFDAFGNGPVAHVSVSDGGIAGVLVKTGDTDSSFEVVIAPEFVSGMSVGDFVSFNQGLQEFGNNYVAGSSLDNKIGLQAAMEIFKQTKDVALVATAQEELNHGCAKIATQTIKPQKAIVIDVTYGHSPEAKTNIELGAGPAICLKDSLFGNKDMIQKLESIAIKKKIPVQKEVIDSGGSDAIGIYDACEGMPFVFIGIPLMFMHTPWEVASLDDLKATIKLLTCYLSKNG